MTRHPPMRIAIISDIHGNMEAFQEVLLDIDRSEVQAIVSLGDNIGYGPEPEQVVNEIRSREIPSVMGNHELAVADSRILEFFNPRARRSFDKTAELLTESTVEYVRNLDAWMILYDCRFVHGFPPDSITTYLFQVSDDQLKAAFGQVKESLNFIGHTHILEIISFDGTKVTRKPLPEGKTCLDRSYRYLINSGSVGQPRDLNNNAKYIILDTAEYSIEARYIPYDIQSVVDKINTVGLPAANASRLW